jgi:vacuolar-type H+-ATPase subunit C/Vma6
MSRISPLNYAYAVSRIRALENDLIGREAFLQAAEAETRDALRLLAEQGRYGDRILNADSGGELETALAGEKRKLLSLIDSLLLDRWLLPLLEADSLAAVVSARNGHPGPFLKDYLDHVIDLHNIKTFLRLRAVGEGTERLAALLAAGGFLEKEFFLRAHGSRLDDWIHELDRANKRGTGIFYGRFFRQAIEEVENHHSFVILETRMADFLIGALRPAKTMVFGPEPLLAYWWARMNEMNLIRLVILSRMNHVPVDQVKMRINDVYA